MGTMLDEQYQRLVIDPFMAKEAANNKPAPTAEQLADREVELANKLIQEHSLFRFFNGSHDIGACLTGDFGEVAQASAEYLFTMIRETSDEAIVDGKVMDQLGEFLVEDLTEKYPESQGSGSIADAMHPVESDRAAESDRQSKDPFGTGEPDMFSEENEMAVRATIEASINRVTGKSTAERDAELEQRHQDRIANSEREWGTNPETGLADHSISPINPDAVVDTFEASFRKAKAAKK